MSPEYNVHGDQEKTGFSFEFVDDDLGYRFDVNNKHFYIKDIDESFLGANYTVGINEFEVWAGQSGASGSAVVKAMRALGFEPSPPQEQYDPILFLLIQEEMEWQKTYSELPNTVSPVKLGKILGRDYRYVTKTAANLDYRLRAGRLNKEVANDIRESDLRIKYDEGWLTIHAISEILGRDRGWVENRLKEHQIIPEPRRQRISNITLDHYDPNVINILLLESNNSPPSGGDWYTKSRMVRETGRSRSWIENRVGAFASQTRYKLDDMRMPRLHYPNTVFQELLAESLHDVIEGDLQSNVEWMIAAQVATLLGISETSARRKMKRLGVTRRLMLDKPGGRLVQCYNTDQVIEISENQNARTSMVSVTQISTITGISYYLVQRYLTELGYKPLEDNTSDLRKMRLYPNTAVDDIRRHHESRTND